jgi:glucose/arabinose dehydrogenase
MGQRFAAHAVAVAVAVAVAAALLLGCGAEPQDAAGEGASSPRSTATAGKAATVAPTTIASATARARRGVRLTRVGAFDEPLYVTAPAGERRRVFVVERGGRIRVIRAGRILSRPFLDLSRRVSTGSEQGLLGLAFAPDYDASGRFYVHYTNRGGDTRVVEYRRASADRADADSSRVVFAQTQPESNHNGGQIAFGPDDLLYIGLGDGGGANDEHGVRGNAQDLSSVLGKILRIDPRPSAGRAYRIPTSNPFVDREGARGEIYAYGLRNPWRFSFDAQTGDLTIGDVGQDAVEEIDHVSRGGGKGANFGWRPYEGDRRVRPDEPAPGHVRPVITRSHAAGWCSITGGVVVRDRAVPALYGRYVFGDFCRGRIYSARLEGRRARQVRPTTLDVRSLASFGEDGRGRVYAVSLAGTVYRLAAR